MADREKKDLTDLLDKGQNTQKNDAFVLTQTPRDIAEWAVSVNGKQLGLFNRDVLGSMLKSGQLPRDFLVWQQDMEDWMPAEMVRELEEIFISLPLPTQGELVAEAKAKVEEEAVIARAEIEQEIRKATEKEMRRRAEEAKINVKEK